ncbi:MAG TPA: FkbM family methyltransferase [Kiritimatiellia bacterium]|nr:FkbM family methyltransferase [Kiritimatiellia bacterium]HMO98708.1 FkbM family methyltransferase [Kiritimatiellia bacterium]HMP97869.1 FkbM family methyltransferase [Kiritimatiellia bacterium]
MELFLKRITLKLSRLLPSFLRRALRRRYYRGVVSNYREVDWEWSPFIKPLVPSGGQVIDIGANVGYLSGLFAQWVGPSGSVLSVEPIPETYDALSASMSTLFPNTVVTIQSCVSDAPGEVTMAVPEYAGGGANYYESRIVDPDSATGARHVNVPATTLDLLIRDRNLNPSFIKIDVEGHELAVIKGGAEFFANHRPPLLIEVAGDPDEPGSAAALLFAMLKGWGYDPHLIRKGTLEVRRVGDQSVDYLFLGN